MKSISFSLLIIVAVSCKNNTNKDVNASLVTKTTNLADQNFAADYEILNQNYGTETRMVIKEGNRIMTTNALPNHETGSFPNPGNPNTISAQHLTYSFPMKPKLSGQSKWAREPGIAINGIKFEPETAERFVCETGEQYRIEAFQELVDLGLDSNHAHVQPTGAYHYHGVPTGLVNLLDTGEDIILVGYAKDGFSIYYSKSGKFKPSYTLSDKARTGDVCSYSTPKTTLNKELKNTSPDGTFVSDWTYQEGLGQLDECNGIVMNDSYCYFVTDEYPYVGRCLKGEFQESRPKGPPPGGRNGRPNRPPGEHQHNGRPHKH